MKSLIHYCLAGLVTVWVIPALVSTAAGQTDSLELPVPGRRPVESPAVPSPASLLGDQLVIHARQILQQGAVAEHKLIRAAILMDLALELNPADADGWLLRRELGKLMGRRSAQYRALKQYVQLRPQDDAAQLEMVLLSASQNQTLEGRITDLERFMDTPGAKALSDAARSRVASFLANAYREMGDEQRFANWLKTAVRLDQSNEQAAKLTYEFALVKEAGADVVGQAILAAVRADPTDPQTRRALADLLLRQGAYQQSATQYRVVWELGLMQADLPFIQNWVLALLGSGRPQDALGLVGEAEAAVYEPQASEPQPPTSPVEIEILRHQIYSLMGQSAKAQATFQRIRRAYELRVSKGDEHAALVLSWLTTLYGPTISDELEQTMTAYAAENPQVALARRVVGWMHLRRNRMEEAARVFNELAESDAFALYGLALSHPRNDALREGYLQRVVRMSPASLEGVMAANELLADGASPQPTTAGRRIVSLLDAMSSRVREPDFLTTPWVMLNVDTPQREYGYLEPVLARVSIRNGTDMRLVMGPDGSIPTRLFVYLTPWRGGEAIPNVPPLVVDLHRRLVLEARQQLDLPVRLDRGGLGHILASEPTASLGFSVTAVLDPVPSADGGVTTGPMGALDLINMLDRRGERPTQSSVERWIIEMQHSSDAIERMKRVAQLAQLIRWLKDSETLADQPPHIARAINTVYPGFDRVLQAWTVLFLPPGEASQELAGVHGLAQRSDDPLIQIAYLSIHGGSPDGAALNAAIRGSSDVVRQYAMALRESIQPTSPAVQVPQPPAIPAP